MDSASWRGSARRADNRARVTAIAANSKNSEGRKCFSLRPPAVWITASPNPILGKGHSVWALERSRPDPVKKFRLICAKQRDSLGAYRYGAADRKHRG